VSRFVFRARVPVERPFALGLTAMALQRLSTNAVDMIDADGRYRRALTFGKRNIVMRVRQVASRMLEVELVGARTGRLLPTAQRMLGTQVDPRPWERRVSAVSWLKQLTKQHAGLRPPRYPTLWEAVAHAVVFQQISIHAAGAIMRRFVVQFSAPLEDDGVLLYPFPEAQTVAKATLKKMLHVGLSANKALALKDAALAFAGGRISEARLQRLPTAEAIAALSALRGIGAWSAAVILLRGLGRLDVFPLNDSGVAATLKLVAPDATVDLDRLLLQLGDQRGMLYFHLLLGRLAHRERIRE